MKIKLWMIVFVIPLYMPCNEASANDAPPERCILLKDEIAPNLIAVTDSLYFQLALDIDAPPGPLLYVASRKPPYRGKAFYVESLTTACRALSLSLRAGDGATAFFFMSTNEKCLDDCSYFFTALIKWNDSEQNVMNFDNPENLRIANRQGNFCDTANQSFKIPELENLIFSVSKSICKLEFGNKGEDLAKCISARSAEDTIQSLCQQKGRH